MSYTPSYVKPYPEGYKNEPIETTPITAEVMNGYDDAIENIENYLADGEMGTVVVANPEIEGTEPNLTALQVGEDKFKIPSGGSASIDYGDEEAFDEWSENAQNGEIFVRTDDNEGGGSGSGTAKSVSYDNSVSELEATNVQDAIDEVFTSVSNGKTLIADAITDKGIETSATDTFQTMADHIAEIEGGSDIAHMKLLYISQDREGNQTYKTKVKAGKYLCILVQGALSSASPTGLTSSGTEIFSYQCAITNSRYCFVKEFKLEEDGWINCSGGYTNTNSGTYYTSRRYIFKVDFVLDSNIYNDIKIEKNYDVTKSVSSEDNKVLLCVLNTVQSVTTDIVSEQKLTEKHNFGNCCFVYDENNGNDYTLSATATTESWSTNVYLGFSIA